MANGFEKLIGKTIKNIRVAEIMETPENDDRIGEVLEIELSTGETLYFATGGGDTSYYATIDEVVLSDKPRNDEDYYHCDENGFIVIFPDQFHLNFKQIENQ